MRSRDYARSRATAHGLIAMWGAPAVLRRASGDRPCMVGIRDYTPQERSGQMTDPVDRIAMLSALEPDGLTVLDPPPDRERDMVVTFLPNTNPPVEDEQLRLSSPPKVIGPSGFVVCWELRVRR